MSALKKETALILGRDCGTYDQIMEKLKVKKNINKKVKFDDIEESMIKPESRMTMKNYVDVKLSDNKEDRLVLKFLDPLNIVTVSIDDYPDIAKMPKKQDYILLFDYPILDDKMIKTVPVIFKIEGATNRILKFKKDEKKSLTDISAAIYSGVCLILLKSDLKVMDRELSVVKTMVSNNLTKLKIDNPLPEEVTTEELLTSMKDADDLVVYVATEGDNFAMPQLFNQIIAETLGLKLDLHISANKVFVDSLSGESSVAKLTDEMDKTRLVSEVILYTEGKFNGMCVKYIKPNEQPSELITPFLPYTQKEYFETYSSTSNRVCNMKLDFDKYVSKEDPIPSEVDVLLIEVTAEQVANLCREFHSTRGMRLVKKLIDFFECESKIFGKHVRFDIDPIEYMLAALYKAAVAIKRKTPVQRVASKNILGFYWAFHNMRVLLNEVGIYAFVTHNEIFYMLKYIFPVFFDGFKEDETLIYSEAPVNKLPEASALTLAMNRSSDFSAAKARMTKEPSTVQSLPSTMTGGRSSLSTNRSASSKGASSAARSGSSGYGSDRFSSASSYGTNCISGHQSVIYKPQVPDFNVVQNILHNGIDLISTNFEHIYYEEGEFHFHTWLNNPAHINEQAVRVCKEDSFVRFYDVERQVRNTRIKLTSPQIDDIMPMSLLDAVMTGVNVDTRKWTSQLMGELRCERKLSEQLAPLLIKHLERYNNSTIYTIGYMIELALADFENDDIAPAFGPIPENSVVVFNTNTGLANVNNEVANMQSYLAEGRVMLRGKDLNSRDYGVMKLISAGPSVVRVGNDAAEKHIISSIICEESVKWCVINDEDTVVPAQVGVITSAHVTSFLTKLVNTFKDSDAMVSGFIQASTILNGKIHEMQRADQPINRFIMSTLEVGQINLPRPRGHTWMWSAIHLEPARCNATYFNDDLTALQGANVQVQNRLSVFVALAVSLGVSAFLDFWNITGADMTSSCLPPVGGNNFGIVFDTLTCAKGKIGAPLLTIACGFINQVSDITINPNVFSARNWCDNLNAIREMVYEPLDLWQAVWNEYVVYLFEPLAATFILKAWPNIWHVLAPDVTFELTTEINMLGPLDLRQWDAYIGTDGYKNTGTSKNPWVKESYGGLVISALRQQLNVRDDWQITFQVYHQAGTNLVKSAETIRFQPQYDADFGIIKIGTLITYNWNIMRTLVPAIGAATIGDGYFHMLGTVKFTNMTSAGIYLPNVQTGHAVSVGVFTDTGISGMEIYATSQATGSARTASEN